MTAPPEPLTPPDCDLRDFAFMPLDVARLMDSSLFARSTGDEFKAAVALWCKAWMQVPAGSLPNDPRDLAYLSGAGHRWAKVKAMALHGWVECSDGRLYHPVVAEKAREAWGKKCAQRERSRRGNEVRWGSHPGRNVPGGSPEGGSESPPDDVLDPSQKDAQAIPQGVAEGGAKESLNDRKRQGQREGQGKKESSLRSLPRASRAASANFADFWQAYPRKVGRGAAEKAFATAIARGASPADIAAGLNRQVWPDNPRFIPHPATWLSQARWQDDPAAAAPREPGKLDYLWPDNDPAPSPPPNGGLIQ